MLKEARFYIKKGDSTLQCLLCPMNCLIKEGKAGICRVRQNQGGVLYSTIYEEVAAVHMDPIEKKPLYHFYPGGRILSVGTRGCSFSCKFCQNWSLVEAKTHGHRATSKELVEAAAKQGSIGIAYTYNEPIIWYEFVYDTALLAREGGLKNVLVTNGFINPEPLEEILPLIDAMNIDLKAMKESFYKELCKGKLGPVKDTIKRAASDCLVEVTNLIIPGFNDRTEDIEGLVDFVASINPDIPLHFSRFFPCHELHVSPTPRSTLIRAHELARRKLRYVYLGNLDTEVGEDTFCPNCNSLVIRRRGYFTSLLGLSGKNCSKCNSEIAIAI